MLYDKTSSLVESRAADSTEFSIWQEKLLTMKKTQSWLANLTLAEIGIDENGRVLEELPPMPEEMKPKEKPKSKSTKTV